VQFSLVKWSSWLVCERVQLSVVSWKSACEEKTMRLVWNGRQPGTQSVEFWQFSWALQGRLRRDGAIVQLTRVQLRDIRRAVTTWAREAEKSPQLEAVTRERQFKKQQAVKWPSEWCSDLWIVEIINSAVITCSSECCVQVVSKSNIHSMPRL
jgi:hypothetical protein